tara:strand:+ start:30057 stop:31544 length:1488 start_codon:yes stop_codon:yes gene_type:complete
VCSGIEAATVAWEPLGWKPVFFAEDDPDCKTGLGFPAAVLAHHWPDVPNYGDINDFQEWPDAAIDVLVGGTPCQSFSVAGLRKGMDDPRGNLALTYLGIADRFRPTWIVWENVPGVLSSNGGRDFGAFLGALGEIGYGWAYRILDAQFFGVAQRRRRLFVVGHLGDWRRAAAVLFERESLQGHPAPRREAGPGVARSLTSSTGGSSAKEQQHTFVGATLGADSGRFQVEQTYIPLNDLGGASHSVTATSTRAGYHDFTVEDYVAAVAPPLEAGVPYGDLSPTIQADNPMAVCYSISPGARELKDDLHVAETDQSKTVDASGADPGCHQGGTMVVCYPVDTYNQTMGEDTTQTLGTSKELPPAVCYSIMPQNSSKDYKAREVEVAQPVMSQPVGGNQGGDYVAHALTARQYSKSSPDPGAGRGGNVAVQNMAVRRLTPRECEALQGFPRGYTLVPYRGKPAADGPRHKALGNSMAVPVVRWIGERIQMVEDILEGD